MSTLTAAQLRTLALNLEGKAGASTTAADTEAGWWQRTAAAAEDIANATTTANPTTAGYQLRAAKALEATAGTTGNEEAQTYDGYLERIADALEVKASATYPGSIANRLTLSSAAAVFSASFNPATLFAASEQGGWWDPSDLSTMFQDSAGTTPAAVGQPVGRVNDKSGRGNHLTQPTTAFKPVLQNSGSLYWLEHDGVDDGLLTAAGVTLAATSDVHLALQTTDTQFVILYDNTNSGLEYLGVVQSGNAGATSLGVGTPDHLVDGSLVTPDTRAQLYTQVQGATPRVLQVTGGSVAFSQIALANYAGGFEFAGNFYGGIINPADATKRASILTYLASKQGRTL